MTDNVNGPQVPEWVKDAIFYQIFPDRFANGDPNNDPENVAPWGSEPTHYNHMGGDLQGIIDRLDYLLDLGINAIYLNPIFWASSNHKYDPYDYRRIDPRFGTLATFTRLLEMAHRNGVKIVLDGVFNHCGRGFFPFFDVMENRQYSAYSNWFYVKEYPLDAYNNHKYQAWQDSRKMPKINILYPPARKYLLDVARYWTEQGIDGWRLDAAADIEDHGFWKELRYVVRSVNPEAYLLGEIWRDGASWLQGDEFDGTMNFRLRELILDFFVRHTKRAQDFAYRLDSLLASCPWSANMVMYNLLGCHDTPRFLTEAGGDVGKVKLAAFFQFVYPGTPAIYYGDEIGLMGGEDPDNRRAMLWDEAKWNKDLRRFFQNLVRVRKEVRPLRRGDWQCIFADEAANTCAFARRVPTDRSEVAIVLINNGSNEATMVISPQRGSLPHATRYLEKLSHQYVHCASNGSIIYKLRAQQGAVLIPA